MSPEAINSVIDNLASKLAIPVGKLMEVLPRIGYKTVAPLVILSVAFGLGICLMVLGIYLMARFNDDYWANIMFLGLGIIIVCLILSPMFFPGYMLWRHDPEAWALDYMFKMLKY